jgi:hypothetical protein
MDLDKIETEKDLLLLKQKVKVIEKKIKENNKPKTITISGTTHNTIKRFCNTLNLNIGEWTEKILLKEIEDSCCIIQEDIVELNNQEEIEKDSDILKEKYIKEKLRTKYLIKSNKLIFGDQFKFVGYSYTDNLPIYEFTGDIEVFKISINFDELGLLLDNVKEFELGNNIKTNKDLEDYVILNSEKVEYNY